MPANSADNSAILALPYIQPSQSQKHVTHNEAISTLDVLVQLVVAGFGATNPPADPAPGDVHALGATPTGAWAGQDNTLATWHDGAWVFITPLAGWRAWGVSEGELRIWDGTAWGLPTVGMDNLDGVGINTTADTTNRLSVSATATLLSHEGADHQLKINKAGATDTASLLFQSGWTGHAEMGLSGGTDFAIKVSDNGSVWTEALHIDGTNGKVGIGTSTPAGALEVNSTNADGIAVFGPVSGSTFNGNIRIKYSDRYPTIQGYSGAVGKNKIILDAKFGAMFMDFDTVLRFRKYTGTTNLVAIDDTGNIGLGVNTPANKLEITNTGDTHAILASNSHATLTTDVVRLKASRTASAAYNLLTAYSGGMADLEFKLSGDGNGTCDGSWTGGGADYAEYFEWQDANPMAEDRRGVSVVLAGDQIREAQAGEEPIGVISGNPSVVGDAAAFRWKGKYQRDDFGSAITEEYEVVSWVETITETVTETEQATEMQECAETTVEIINGAAAQTTVTKTRDIPLFDEYPLSDADGNDLGIHREPRMIEVTREVTREVAHSYAMDEVPAGITVPKDAVRVTQTRRKMNPDYTPGSAYTPREDRPEWDTVGLMGKLRIRKGQAIGAGWVRMRNISDTIEEWLVR